PHHPPPPIPPHPPTPPTPPTLLPFFFFNDTATPEISTTRHTLSLPDALPISAPTRFCPSCGSKPPIPARRSARALRRADRKSTRLNSSHALLSRMPSSA